MLLEITKGQSSNKGREKKMDSISKTQTPSSPVPAKRTLLVVDGSYVMISAQKMKMPINYTKFVSELERTLGCEVVPSSPLLSSFLFFRSMDVDGSYVIISAKRYKFCG